MGRGGETLNPDLGERGSNLIDSSTCYLSVHSEALLA